MDDHQEVTATSTPFTRAKLACQECRVNKVRCLPWTGSQPGDPCERCRRLGRNCIPPLINKRRGRPPRPSIDESLQLTYDQRPAFPHSTSSVSDHYRNHLSDLMNPHPQPLQHYQHPPYPHQAIYPPQPPSTAYPAQPPQVLVAPPPAPVEPTHHHITPGSSSSRTHSTPRLHPPAMKTSEFLDPEDESPPRGMEGRRGVKRRWEGGEEGMVFKGDDPISLCILTLLEAQYLLRLFYERLNPLIALFDPALHTLPYLRQTPILLTTILSSSSKFFRKDLHPSLLSHSQISLDRALSSGAADVSLIQSLMVLVYFKTPEDGSAWRKIGLALRMGYMFRLHRVRELGEDMEEEDLREVLNAERTWLCLFCFDRNLSWAFGLPTTIRLTEMIDIEAWARSHLHLGHTVDMHLAASHELIKLTDHCYTLLNMSDALKDYRETAIENMILQCDVVLRKWFSPGSPPPGFHLPSETVTEWTVLNLKFILLRHLFDLVPADPLRLDRCLAIVARIVEQIEVVAEGGWLEVLQDTAAVMTSTLGMFLRKVFPRLSRPQKSMIISWLSKLLKIHETVSKSDTGVATAFIARFIRRTLNMIMAESRVPSRAGTPGFGALGMTEDGAGRDVKGLGLGVGLGGDGMISGVAGGGVGGGSGIGNGFEGGEEVVEDIFESLGLGSLMDLPHTEMDDQYWSQIFSSDPFNLNTPGWSWDGFGTGSGGMGAR